MLDQRKLRNARLLIDEGMRALPRDTSHTQPSFLDRLIAASGGSTPRESRFHVSWDELGIQARDASVAGTGAYLVAEDVRDATERPLQSDLLDYATVLTNCQGDVLIPRTVTPSTGGWLANEGSSITPADAVIGQVVLTPKVHGVSTGVSRLLQLQGGAVVDRFIRRDIVRETRNAITAAALAGAGSAGEPLGLVNDPLVDVNSGASLDLSDILTAQATVAAFAGARDSEVEWLAHGDVRKLLAARESVSGNGGFIWANNAIAGQRARVTSNAPAATLFCGLWSELVIALWGPGIEVEVDTHASFKTGAIAYRVIVAVDCAARQPEAFSILGTVS